METRPTAGSRRPRPGARLGGELPPPRVPGRGRDLRQVLPRRRLDELLEHFGALSVAVVGDFFLDAYYDCDGTLDEPSLETGRTCHQVVRTRRQPGAAGTVAANLVALGVGRVSVVGFCGDDGEGWELRRALDRLGLDTTGFDRVPGRFTPTYGKPCYVERAGRRWQVREELERIDIKNRRPTPGPVQDRLLADLEETGGHRDAIVVVDQVTEDGCGVVTPRVRRRLEGLAQERPGMVFLADSRERIGRFRRLPIKPNHHEAAAALGVPPARSVRGAADHARRLAGRAGRTVYVTLSARGMVVSEAGRVCHVAGFPVDGPVDPVGAGDAATAALVSCLAAGATPVEAALVANLAASVTVQQIGTTGTAPPSSLRRRWRQVNDDGPTAP